MDWQRVNAKMQTVEEFPQLEEGDYRIRIEEFYYDKVKDFERLCFRFVVENIGDAIPNKIFFLYPVDETDEKNLRTTTFKWRRFCRCFGLDPKNVRTEPAAFLKRVGRVKIARDNWGYLNVCHFYPANDDETADAKKLAKAAGKEDYNF